MGARALPRASARVVSPLHLRIMRLVASAERAYGAIGLRLEGGTALARGLGRSIVTAFPLRLLVYVTEEAVQGTIRLGLEECARLARERTNWDPGLQD